MNHLIKKDYDVIVEIVSKEIARNTFLNRDEPFKVEKTGDVEKDVKNITLKILSLHLKIFI